MNSAARRGDDPRLDAVVLVPFQPYSGHAIEPQYRNTLGSQLYPHILEGYSEFARFVGRDLTFRPGNRPAFGGDGPVEFPVHRSLTAVALATLLERAGLRWEVLDPGQQEIRWWRKQLEALAPRRPRCVGVSTTFVLGGRWLRALLAVVRDVLPGARVILGGYYYTSDAADFLSMDADVFCIGAGEGRFERVVQGLRDGASLDGIPGLYLREPDGGLRNTGRAEDPPLDTLAPPDWSLVDRIAPPRDGRRDLLDVGLETQRGCVFKCEFCTYRTLAPPNIMDVDLAVERVLATRAIPRAIVRLTDSTATFPHARWESFMERLAARGGSPHPLWVYARVSDIAERTAGLMAAAGVREVFIGQESGDQRVLGLMRKGTHVRQVRPALEALQRNGIWAFMAFIHGFPGETAESIGNTRALIASLNEGFPEDRPAVAWYNANPFLTQDFASVTERTDSMRRGVRYLGFDEGANTSRRMSEESVVTMLAASRVPHAPVFVHMLTLLDSLSRAAVEPEPAVMGHPRRYAFQRWVKAVERGVVIFMERALEGRAPDLGELRRVRARVLEGYPGREGLLRRGVTEVTHRVLPVVGRYLRAEWSAEHREGVGPATRVGLAAMALADTGRPAAALASLRTGEYHPATAATPATPAVREAAWDLAAGAITDAKQHRARLADLVRKANERAKAT